MGRDIGERKDEKNCLYPHNSKESMEHWLAKALIFKNTRKIPDSLRRAVKYLDTIV